MNPEPETPPPLSPREPSGPQPVPPGFYFLPAPQPAPAPAATPEKVAWRGWLQIAGVLGVFASLLSLQFGTARLEGTVNVLVENQRALTVRVDSLDVRLSARIDGLDARVSALDVRLTRVEEKFDAAERRATERHAELIALIERRLPPAPRATR